VKSRTLLVQGIVKSFCSKKSLNTYSPLLASSPFSHFFISSFDCCFLPSFHSLHSSTISITHFFASQLHFPPSSPTPLLYFHHHPIILAYEAQTCHINMACPVSDTYRTPTHIHICSTHVSVKCSIWNIFFLSLTWFWHNFITMLMTTNLMIF